MTAKYTYFLSDLHLGASYRKESKVAERRVVDFLTYISEDAQEIFLLGDILDYWFEYKYVVPRGFVRFFGKLAELSDKGIKITWLIGNHDIWIFDYLPDELGVKVVDGHLIKEIAGRKIFMAHGDGQGKLPASFKFLRGIFRNRVFQFLYSGIHPRWTVPFAYNWSKYSRAEGEQRGIPDIKLLDNLKEFVEEDHKINPQINFYIFGHVHVLAKEMISDTCEMIVLGEWLKTYSFARLGEGGMQLMIWDNENKKPINAEL